MGVMIFMEVCMGNWRVKDVGPPIVDLWKDEEKMVFLRFYGHGYWSCSPRHLRVKLEGIYDIRAKRWYNPECFDIPKDIREKCRKAACAILKGGMVRAKAKK